jgi:hypothetical protein
MVHACLAGAQASQHLVVAVGVSFVQACASQGGCLRVIACRGLKGETRGERKPGSERGERASEERLRVQGFSF